jgi:hypothetical protein
MLAWTEEQLKINAWLHSWPTFLGVSRAGLVYEWGNNKCIQTSTRRNWRQETTWKCKLNSVAWVREELYRPSKRRFSGELVPTFADRGYYVVSLTNPYGRLCGLVVPGYRSRARVRFPALPDFLRSSGSGTGSTQPREYNWGATWKRKQRLRSWKCRKT